MNVLRWLWSLRSLRIGVITGLALGLLAAAANLHACACTGGNAHWHSLSEAARTGR